MFLWDVQQQEWLRFPFPTKYRKCICQNHNNLFSPFASMHVFQLFLDLDEAFHFACIWRSPRSVQFACQCSWGIPPRRSVLWRKYQGHDKCGVFQHFRGISDKVWGRSKWTGWICLTRKGISQYRVIFYVGFMEYIVWLIGSQLKRSNLYIQQHFYARIYLCFIATS